MIKKFNQWIWCFKVVTDVQFISFTDIFWIKIVKVLLKIQAPMNLKKEEKNIILTGEK